MQQFHILEADDASKVNILSSMHHLRWQVFHQELKWSVGLNICNCMEFDQYDRKGAYYIVRTTDDGVVDATCRLMPTSKPYMLGEHYSEFIEKCPIPNSDDVWEFSRTCASQEARLASQGSITGQLITAAVEFGLVKGVKNYISLTTDTLLPLITRKIGWPAEMLGPKKATPDDMSYSLKYEVTHDILGRLREKNSITQPLLYEFDSGMKNIRELWNDNKLSQAEKKPEAISSGAGSIGRNQLSPFLS